MKEALTKWIAELFSLAILLSVLLYCFACILMGKKKAGQAVGYLITGVGRGTIKVAARILKILIMFVINLTTMIIRIIFRPDQVHEAWTRFIERMADVIFGA